MQRRSTVLGLVWLHGLEGAGGGGGRGGVGLLIVADQMHGFLEALKQRGRSTLKNV